MPKKVSLKNYYLDIGNAVGMAIVGHTIFLYKNVGYAMSFDWASEKLSHVWADFVYLKLHTCLFMKIGRRKWNFFGVKQFFSWTLI